MSSALRTPDALPAIGTISYVRLPVEIGQFTSSRRINQLAAQLDRHADWSLKQGRILAPRKPVLAPSSSGPLWQRAGHEPGHDPDHRSR